MNEQDEIIDDGIIESMGISQQAFSEIQAIIGRIPTIAELSTLLAMWQSNGTKQSLYGWLKGQHHSVERHDYIYTGNDEEHKTIREPKIKECIEIAQSLKTVHKDVAETESTFKESGDLIYMVGNIASEFLGSEYARKYLHLASEPLMANSLTEEVEYTEMILHSMLENGMLETMANVATGGIFNALTHASYNEKGKHKGFDILTCKEVRLDAFLFGEKPGRFIISIKEASDDQFLAKLSDARLNCCFLGRVTKGRIVIDGMDFGESSEYLMEVL